MAVTSASQIFILSGSLEEKAMSPLELKIPNLTPTLSFDAAVKIIL